MRQRLFLLIFACVAAIAAGCRPDVHTAMAVADEGYRHRRGNMAPVLPLRTPDGRQRKLTSITGPLYVVGFVPAPPADRRNPAHPWLNDMAHKLRAEQVWVVQINVPAADAPWEDDCLARMDAGARNLLNVCDPMRSAHKAFGRPDLGTLLLVNHDGTIYESGTIDHPERVLEIARREAEAHRRYIQSLLGERAD